MLVVGKTNNLDGLIFTKLVLLSLILIKPGVETPVIKLTKGVDVFAWIDDKLNLLLSGLWITKVVVVPFAAAGSCIIIESGDVDNIIG